MFLKDLSRRKECPFRQTEDSAPTIKCDEVFMDGTINLKQSTEVVKYLWISQCLDCPMTWTFPTESTLS